MFSMSQYHQLPVHWCVVSFSQAKPVSRLVGTKAFCWKIFCHCSWGPCLAWGYSWSSVIISKPGHKCTTLLWVWSIQSVHLLSFDCSHWSLLKLIIPVQCGSVMQGTWMQWKIMLKSLSVCVIPVWCIWTAESCVMGWLLLDICKSSSCFAFSTSILYMEVMD